MKISPDAAKIEKLKSLWEKVEISPYQFFSSFYSKYSLLNYREFVVMINVDENYSKKLQRAVSDFLIEYKLNT